MTSPTTLHTSEEPKSQAPAMNREEKEEEMEKEEEEAYGGWATRAFSCAMSQDKFLTPQQSSQSLQLTTGETKAGEGASGAVFVTEENSYFENYSSLLVYNTWI
ncbi:traB domain-containing protein [Platysternon megacephalum]|uniref:TraB domain-containing protein n=1 Tax=Platysternon megacephalum TaxID=55544 RepID=A0A4D9ENP7_9SAUR|nr:traB domain-containing protein [Platysternon megacephalum]